MMEVREVANWFLTKEGMTHKKIQKLCYYAQAWHCALLHQPLFRDEIQAWVHGPVVPSLYPVYADYKWNHIPKIDNSHVEADEDAESILEAVWNTYSDLSGDQLESLTHSEDPWMNARGNVKPWETSTIPISQKSMETYYGKKYEEAQND